MLIKIKTVIAGVPDLHGLPVPVIQHPGEHEQLRRVVWLRVHLDRGAMQAWGPAGNVYKCTLPKASFTSHFLSLQDLMYDILRQTVKKESENSYEPLDPAYQRN